MSTRARSRMSVSFQPADLTTTTNTILEEGEPTESVQDHELDTSTSHYTTQHDQQAELIAKLRQRINDLETDAETTTSLGELQRAQREWQTSEDLLRGSQRDNEQKHETIEQYKIYVKDLERIIDETLGPNWKADHQVRPPLSQSVCFSASTPLPKPSAAALRRSVSILPSTKRSSKVITRHASISTLGTFNPLAPMSLGVKDDMEMDDTPTGAMRKLMGSSTRVLSQRMADKQVQPANLRLGTTSPMKPRSVSADCPTIVPSRPAAPQLDENQVQVLLTMLASTARLDKTTNVPDEKMLLQTLERIEKAERSADARELRLKTMLEEARAQCI